MSQDDVTQIRVGNSLIGIVGLKAVMQDMAEEYGDRPDREVQEELLNRLGRRNYIPEKAREDYEKTFLREFKKFLGKPFEEEVPEGLEIKVLGPGCALCDRLERELMEVMAEMNLSADFDHITDIKEIARYGVMGTPALLIDGNVRSVGRVPPQRKIKQWLEEASKE